MTGQSILDRMKSADRWLLANPEKVPHYVDGSRRSGQLDSAEDRVRLCSYDKAKAALEGCDPGWHLGFALGPDGDGGHWQGIDFDHIAENLLQHLADDLPGYVEQSPSGEGVHAIGYGRSFRSLGSNGCGIEAYSRRRFFTVTESMVREGGILCLADHVENTLAPLHRAKATNLFSTAKASEVVQVSRQTVADLRSALNYMRSDDYALWIEMGHALKTLGDTGRGLWLDWSATSSKFDPQQTAAKWGGFDPQHTGHRAVFVRAQERGWVNPASSASIFANFAGDGPTGKSGIAAAPFAMPAFFEIPPRPWILGHWLLRGTVTTLVAPGGTGKSSLMIAAALSIASGRELLGKTVWGGPQRVWLWNLEDDKNELDRQFAACIKHHGISGDFGSRLFVNDASSTLCTATRSREGLVTHEPVIDALIEEIYARQIDVLIVDPFVSSHRAEENDNGQIDAVAKNWARVARDANCSILLVHHSRKLAGQQVDAESARGASALGNAARTVLVQNRMEAKEATRLEIPEDERRSYFRVSNDKSNRAPPEVGDWYHLASVDLQNGGPQGGDRVGAVERWNPPDFTNAFDDEVRAKIQSEIAAGDWRAYHSANDWAGIAVARVIGADLNVPADKRRSKALLDDMQTKGQLLKETKKDAHRKDKVYVVVGEPVAVSCGSPMW